MFLFWKFCGFVSLGYILYIASLENGCFHVYHLDEKVAQKVATCASPYAVH